MADELGGGIFNDGTLTISNSTVSGNSMRFTTGNGAGIANFFSDGDHHQQHGERQSVNGIGGIVNAGTLTIGNTILNAGTFGANLGGSGTVNSSAIT